MHTIKRTHTPKDHLINDIVDLEWWMFDRVNNIGGRAGCQNDSRTFYIMRYSQFFAWPVDALESYKQDLLDAQAEGRNLLTEKYAYMMAYTDPRTYEATIRGRIPEVSVEKAQLVDAIAALLTADEQAFAAQYPRLHHRGRPVEGAEAGNVSMNVYALGELKTYSEQTLRLYAAHLLDLKKSGGENISVTIHRAMVSFYGYASLEAAEAGQG
ncbi:MAG: DUF4125 family protein [Peptococcaceae bacterium]|nr:DUF4125 family protein [Peptococcaceae bacterium]